MTKPTTITIPPDTLSASQIAAVVQDIQDSFRYFERDQPVKVKAEKGMQKQVEAQLECKG